MGSINASDSTETPIIEDLSLTSGPVYGVIEDSVVTMRDFSPVNAPPRCINSTHCAETRFLEGKE